MAIFAYKVVFFDLDHTLVDTRKQYDLGLARTNHILYPNGVPASWQEHFMHHHEQLWELYDRRVLTMQQLRRERFILAWRDFGEERSVAEADHFQDVYLEGFQETLFPYPGTLAMVKVLAQQYRLAIVTNGAPDLQEAKLQAAGLSPYFPRESLIVSEQVGEAKPHPSVYAAACAAMGVQAGQAVMVGDNLRADVEGAKAFGLDAIWYVPDAGMAATAHATVGRMPLTQPQQVLQELNRMEQARG
ncbi:HAD family hydrolase [Alicyclobacillaceae bacterium I2511]|nr:HAD family hydrolase [Alicyclobacillaceae bacterium I2511]